MADFSDIGINLFSIDFAGIAMVAVQTLLVILVLWVGFHFLIFRVRKYKDIIFVVDESSGGRVLSKDRGGWVFERGTNTGYYRLMKAKNTRLKHPPKEAGIISKKGKSIFVLFKYGESPYDYEVADFSRKDAQGLPVRIPLADEDWAKHSVRKAGEKARASGFWSSPAGAATIVITAMVISLIIMLSIVKLYEERVTADYSQSAELAGKWQEIIDRADRLIDNNKGNTNNPPATEPPPNF